MSAPAPAHRCERLHSQRPSRRSTVSRPAAFTSRTRRELGTPRPGRRYRSSPAGPLDVVRPAHLKTSAPSSSEPRLTDRLVAFDDPLPGIRVGRRTQASIRRPRGRAVKADAYLALRRRDSRCLEWPSSSSCCGLAPTRRPMSLGSTASAPAAALARSRSSRALDRHRCQPRPHGSRRSGRVRCFHRDRPR